jgi:hypothetical protein
METRRPIMKCNWESGWPCVSESYYSNFLLRSTILSWHIPFSPTPCILPCILRFTRAYATYICRYFLLYPFCVLYCMCSSSPSCASYPACLLIVSMISFVGLDSLTELTVNLKKKFKKSRQTRALKVLEIHCTYPCASNLS